MVIISRLLVCWNYQSSS